MCIEMQITASSRGQGRAVIFISDANKAWRLLHCYPDSAWPAGSYMRTGGYSDDHGLTSFYKYSGEVGDDVVFKLSGFRFPPELSEGAYLATPCFEKRYGTGQWYPILTDRLLRAAQEELSQLREELIVGLEQLSLDAASLIPGPVGEGFTLASAAFALRHEDYCSAAVSFAALCPVLGEFFQAAKVGRLVDLLKAKRQKINFLSALFRRSNEVTKQEQLTGDVLKTAIQNSAKLPAKYARIGPIGKSQAFKGFRNFRYQKVDALRAYLEELKFEKVQDVREFTAVRGGTPEKDYSSEIWIRLRPEVGQYECVRIDPIGHTAKPPAVPTGAVKLHPPPPGEPGRVFFGNVPHYHLETVPKNLKDVYLKAYVAGLPQYNAAGNCLNILEREYQEALQWSERIWGANSVARGTGMIQASHIPLSR